MPQASNEDREKMNEYFGDPIDDGPPSTFLISLGYTESRGWWSKPAKDHQPTQKELDCLNFLCDEWDHAYDFTEKP